MRSAAKRTRAVQPSQSSMYDYMQAVRESYALDVAFREGGISALIHDQAESALEDLSDGDDDGDASPPDDAAVVPG